MNIHIVDKLPSKGNLTYGDLNPGDCFTCERHSLLCVKLSPGYMTFSTCDINQGYKTIEVDTAVTLYEVEIYARPRK